MALVVKNLPAEDLTVRIIILCWFALLFSFFHSACVDSANISHWNSSLFSAKADHPLPHMEQISFSFVCDLSHEIAHSGHIEVIASFLVNILFPGSKTNFQVL